MASTDRDRPERHSQPQTDEPDRAGAGGEAGREADVTGEGERGEASGPGPHGAPPVFRASGRDPARTAPLTGSESGTTVQPSGTPEERAAPGQGGDGVDGDEGSATGSRTSGQTGTG
jgi:hypothetical protein